MINNKRLFFCFLLLVSALIINAAEPSNLLGKAVRSEDMRAVRQITRDCGGIDGVFFPTMGWTCLMEAADSGRMCVIEYCLGKQANIEMRDLQGNTALAWSLLSTYYSPKLLAFYKLLFHGADYATQSDSGSTVAPLINALNLSPKSKECIKKRAIGIVEDRIYWLCKGLSKKGNLPEDLIVASVLPYMYGDIQVHNEDVANFLTINYMRFFNSQVACAQLRYDKKDRRLYNRVSYEKHFKKKRRKC